MFINKNRGFTHTSFSKHTNCANKKVCGFTLIELLVVIAIIGILSSVVLASLNSAREKSRDARRVGDVKQLQLALEMYYDAHDNYPQALTDLVSGSFIPAVPVDPKTNIAYTYGVDANPATDYVLMATLENAGNKALNTDEDTDTYSVSCADASGANHYCVRP